ncbi:hypothetical protein WL40_12560 [Burkholderia ubonensis]|uniref:fimbrial protein n=1 Tax=Burkholderia ubonensis TaxID=101571 RepID=UPI00075B9D71|nr:fimbrial protein [Burkholderia ubonensis]KWB69836.1 hypothetical protein WL40_12560 [Burkholderia ubonensis]
MKTKHLLIPLLCTAAALTGSAYASDGTITFTGAINTQTCKITGGGDVSVQLPNMQATALKAAGDTAGDTRFKIAVSGCDTSQQQSVYAAFEPGPNLDPATGNLKLQGADAAKNVQIGLKNLDNTPITIGDSTTVKAVPLDKNGAATMEYVARYVATDAAAAGSASTNVTYSLNYQ